MPFALPPAPSCPSSPREEARPTRLFGKVVRSTPLSAASPTAPTVQHEQTMSVGLGLDLSSLQSQVPAVVSPPIRFYSTSHMAHRSPPLPSKEGSQSPQEICNASFSGDFDPRPRPESAQETGALRRGRGRLSLFDLPLRNQSLLAQSKLKVRDASQSASGDHAVARTERGSRSTMPRHAQKAPLPSGLDSRVDSHRPAPVTSSQALQGSMTNRRANEPFRQRLDLDLLRPPSGSQSLVGHGSDRSK